ncbi:MULTISPECIES: sigma factor-like helix-turn-helix DNA-binding protein [Acidobacteriaceae]|uniref:sigma factor-like helix-turn-helix DNA-binding protein n=1 Tax=Acidobacteriaceae TaxID=204434 RepID=UPI00131E210B|nr:MULTISPECIES: sigma factor-like helix-turn-helix DNA-binding protein [Acidobacteriaceae]MDW5265716.1 sigma factor-like helix-turn-helix DNA-binding protein [Edaphobacter sp.]
MSAALVLPMVWATAPMQKPVRRKPAPAASLDAYRKYTEALLRRYSQMAMETGRVPSLLGRELFRGKVTNYVVHGFDDVVIFVHDVEHCLEKLNSEEYRLIERVALQEYTLEETAALLGLPVWTVSRQYGHALDEVTEMFLEREMLERLICCQEPKTVDISLYH